MGGGGTDIINLLRIRAIIYIREDRIIKRKG